MQLKTTFFQNFQNIKLPKSLDQKFTKKENSFESGLNFILKLFNFFLLILQFKK